MDWDSLKKIAFGHLGLMPDQFWGLTLGELQDLAHGLEERENMEWRKLAQLAAWIMSPHLKKPISGKDLFGLGGKADPERIDPARKKEELENLERELGV